MERLATGNMAVATVPHFTTRASPGEEPAPQLHTHGVFLNDSWSEDGELWSTESQPLYKLQKALGTVYHQQHGAEARASGYAVTIAADSTFELDVVRKAVPRRR